MEGEFSSLSTPDLVDQITTLAGHLNAANARFLTLVAELDRRRGWAEWGVKSCAHWLNWQCGIESGRGAREAAGGPCAWEAAARLPRPWRRAGSAMSSARATDPGRGCGERGLPPQHRAVRDREPRRECGAGLSPGAGCRGADPRGDPATRPVIRCATRIPDGSLVIRGRLPAEIGALFMKALEAAEDSLPIPKNVSAERLRTNCTGRRKRRVEALAVLAESFLASGSQDLSGGDRQQIVVHVDAETLQTQPCRPLRAGARPFDRRRDRKTACLRCERRRVSSRTSRANHSNVGRKTRTIPPAIRRALNSRDKGCRFPGCSFKRYVDGHHVKHWAQGGETKLSNLVTLCRFHHRLVHEGQVDDPDARRWGVPVRPAGRKILRQSRSAASRLGGARRGP